MRTRPGSWGLAALAGGVAIAACQAEPIATPASPKPVTVAASARPTAAPSKGVEPVAPTAAPTPAGPRVAAGTNTLLTGTVRLDPAYAIAHARGSVLTNNGGTVVANNGGNVLVLAPILADGGVGLVSDHGGTAISRYQLAQAPSPDTLLPVAGMALLVRSLQTGEPVPVLDTAGKPFYPILTDAQGRFSAPIPADTHANVLIEASVPGNADPKLAVSLVTPGETATAADARAVDEDTALVTTYVRRSMGTRARDMLVAKDKEALLLYFGIGEFTVPELRDGLAKLFEAASTVGRVNGVPAAPPAEQLALGQRMADVALAHFDLAGVRTDPLVAPNYQGAPEPAFAALVDVVRQIRAGAAGKLATDPAYFEKQPYLAEANKRRAPQPPLVIAKPGDLSDVLFETYLLAERGFDAHLGIRDALDPLAIEVDPSPGKDLTNRLIAAARTLEVRIGMTLLTNEAVKQEAFAAVEAWGRARKAP